MSTDATWTQSEARNLWWLRREYSASLGLLERRTAPPRWYVARWIPNERHIADLPTNLPLGAIQDIARLLILAPVGS